jgi:hypothetical protein
VHPLDLPEGYHTVPRGQARPAVGRGVAPGAPCGRAALSTGCHPAPACKIRDRCGESGREHLTQNQMFGGRKTAGRPTTLLVYISCTSTATDDHGHSWT